MGFFSKVFGGLFTPKREPQPQPEPVSARNSGKNEDVSHAEGPKYSGREEETKAQKNADPETREIVKEAQEYPKADQPNPGADAAKAAGKTKSPESPKAQPKPGAKQRKKPTHASTGKSK